MMISRSTLLGLAVAFAICGPPAFAAGADAAPTGDKASNALYWEGQAALKQSDWSTALKRFEDLEKLLRRNEPKSVDAALYWEAYTLVQAKRTAQAKTVIERLRRDFPDSRWGRDADALLAQTQPATKVEPGVMDDDLADIAVEGLMNAPPERAVPLLRKVLASTRSAKVKKRALFVLSQIDSPEAMNVVLDTAKNSREPELRREAIQMLGISGEKAAIEGLSGIYAASTDADEKSRVIEAWLVADRKDLVLKSARTEADPGLRRKAIEILGAMDASEELRQLFDATQDAANRRAIVHSLGVAGNASALVDIYGKAATAELRQATLEGLLITGDVEAVKKIYRSARSTEEKKAVLRTLTIMDDDGALDIIEQELGK